MSPTIETMPLPSLFDLPAHEVVDHFLEQAAELRASDLYFTSEESHVSVSVRHLGLVRHLGRLPRVLGHHCIAHVKALADMDTTEHRRTLDGRWLHDRPDGRRIDLRVNILPTLHGEDCALRLLTREVGLRALYDLGMIRREYNDLLAMLNTSGGLILLTGPTGAGKTTTGYACLRYLNDGTRKIHTIEDPIEYEVEGVRQSAVNPRLDVTFPELLRSVLRHAPDVILIGEIRDPVAATTAVQAAICGHLVLATVHAPVATGAIETMRALGIPPYFLASALLGVVAQRLVRTLCGACAVPVPLDALPHTFDEVRPWLELDQGKCLYAARGCPACRGTGYTGRTGVFEVLRISHAVRRAIAEGQPGPLLREQAVKGGLLELRQAALLKVAQGKTTAEEVIRTIPPEYLGLEG